MPEADTLKEAKATVPINSAENGRTLFMGDGLYTAINGPDNLFLHKITITTRVSSCYKRKHSGGPATPILVLMEYYCAFARHARALDMLDFQIRFATPADAEVISWHRARMFQDMGLVPDKLFEHFCMKSLEHLRPALASGQYLGWLVSESGEPEKIIAGAGVILREIPPFPLPHGNGEITIADGRQALILNVFTEPEWRRRGLAGCSWSESSPGYANSRVESIILHASDDGRALYEQLGFSPTTEMRLLQ